MGDPIVHLLIVHQPPILLNVHLLNVHQLRIGQGIVDELSGLILFLLNNSMTPTACAFNSIKKRSANKLCRPDQTVHAVMNVDAQ